MSDWEIFDLRIFFNPFNGEFLGIHTLDRLNVRDETVVSLAFNASLFDIEPLPQT